ncbi:carbohydrate-binding protein [Actinospica durhamensis]|uniref:Carbohydrate-binding protein n=1 Tax=Actinospica durhamensis TaxID=1508375 RepID=A0A941EQ89_9ACTN|nr:carbohydrate-binding protein [Actinospica durhamensis]
MSGTEITIATTTGETIDLAPAGTSLTTIQNELSGGEGAYGGTPAAVPGTVQAENYDTGGQGAAYNVTSVNGTGTGYRADGVDLETTSDTGGGYDLGWTGTGQWFNYTVNVADGATYTASFRVAGDSAVSDAFHIANAAGTNLGGSVSVPSTGGWQNWTTVTATFTLPAGIQTLTLDEDNGGWNINSMSFASSGYSTGFETGQPQPTWTDTVDTSDTHGGGLSNVGGLCCGLTGPEAGVRSGSGEQAHTGTSALMYSGSATAANAHAYMQVIDLSSAPVPVDANTVLTYWIFPQSNATTTWVPAGSTDSECVAVDMIFSDGSDLRDSGVKDQNGVTDHPASMCGHLTLDTWNQVTVNLGSVKSGLSIDKILLGYDQASGASGGYRGYIDDLSIAG